jgi:hypothetical protein
MSVNLSCVPFCLLAVTACLVLEPACTNATGNGTGFGDDGGSGSASSGSGASGSTSGSSAGSVSGSGSSSSSGSASGSGSGTGSGAASDGGACSPTAAAGAIPVASNYLAASVIGKGGYTFSYSDGKGSTACNDMTAFCGAGTTAIADPMGTIWGAGLGANLNQAMATSSASPPVGTYSATGSGIAYTISNLPTQGMRLIIDNSATDYCAPLSAASGTVKWASFNSKCWDGSGTSLTGAPTAATHVQFQVTAGPAAGPFNFCVTAVSFAP